MKHEEGKALLGICIPTFNRKTFLKESLEAICKEIGSANVPIFVCDNHSEDGTLEMLAWYKTERFPKLYYRQNPSNLGFDRNLINCVAMADTRYVWLLSDDDLIEKNAIKDIIAALAADPGVLLVNSGTYNVTFTTQVEESHAPLNQDKLYHVGQHRELLRDLGHYATFQGAIVIKRDAWLPEIHGMQDARIMDRGFIHWWVLFRYAPSTKTQFVSRPMVKVRLNNASWSAKTYQTLNTDFSQVVWSLPETAYPSNVKTRICPRHTDLSVKTALFYRCLGWYDSAVFNEVLAQQPVSYARRTMLRIIARMPNVLLKRLLIHYLLVRNRKSDRLVLWEITGRFGPSGRITPQTGGDQVGN